MISTLVVAVVVTAVDFAMLSEGGRLFLINARYGCFPWSPKIVPYRDSMTLCPGQSAFIDIRPLPSIVRPARNGI